MKQIRQGDVLFTPTAKLPSGSKEKVSDNTVAYGEVTGHSHTLMSADQADVLRIGGGVYVVIRDGCVSIDGDLSLILPELEKISRDETETPLRRATALQSLGIAPQAKAIFLHGSAQERAERPVPSRNEDRHLPVFITTKISRIGIQRQWSPEAISNVAD